MKEVKEVPIGDRPAGAATTADEVVLRAVDISKVFPGTVALDEVDFNVYRGKVNVLVGENGAGKSTLMKILAGVYKPTGGRLVLNGEDVEIRSPLDAARHGIGIIYQEMNLFPNLSVSENIFMTREITRGGVIDRQAQKERTVELLAMLQQKIDPDTPVANLRIGQQQIVEIAKALAQDVQILIMDEPTSALSNAEVEVLFEVIRDLKERDVSIIYISHKLDELLQIGDYVTILRDGLLVEEERAERVDIQWIIEKMVGRNPATMFRRENHTIGERLLEVKDLTLPRVGIGYLLDHVSFTLHRGEILGIYGLMGAGRSELFECLTGARKATQGKVWLDGKEMENVSVDQSIKMGMALVPEDRQRDGLVQTMSVADNILLASLRRYLQGFHLSRRKEKSAVEGSIRDLSVKVADAGQLVTSLSGGNQQKVVVAKTLLTQPKVLLLDEPTRGIDVGAKSEIFEIMSRLAVEGYGIIFVSSELKEVLAMSDRILVMSRGKITGEFAREEATEAGLVQASAAQGPSKNGSRGENL